MRSRQLVPRHRDSPKPAAMAGRLWRHPTSRKARPGSSRRTEAAAPSWTARSCASRRTAGPVRQAPLPRAEPHYYAFDCLWLDGRDLREPAPGAQAHPPRVWCRRSRRALLFVDHVAGTAWTLYRAACAMDLEGIIAKWPERHGTEPPSWIKAKNPAKRDPILDVQLGKSIID